MSSPVRSASNGCCGAPERSPGNGRRGQDLRTLSVCLLGGVLSATVGCSSGTSVHIRPCTAAAPVVSLTQFQYVSIDPATDSGCALFPAATAQAAEYLVVPQLATGVPAQTAAFRLVGDTII